MATTQITECDTCEGRGFINMTDPTDCEDCDSRGYIIETVEDDEN